MNTWPKGNSWIVISIIRTWILLILGTYSTLCNGKALERPYGSWKSPITSDTVVEDVRSFVDLQIDPTNSGTVYWTESRPDEEGRYVVCSQDGADEGSYQEWTPKGFNARTRVHEYGGLAFLIQDGIVYFSNFGDGRLYKQTAPSATPEAITPDVAYRYAEGVFAKDGIFIIREDHTAVEKKEAKEPTNTIVYINLETGDQTIVAEGPDFYASPSVSPNGTTISWLQWFHPNMPWDPTEIWIADLEGTKAVNSRQLLARPKTSYVHPTFSPDNILYYSSDETNWWNLYEYETGKSSNIYPVQAETDGPLWSLTNEYFSFDPDPASKRLVLLVNETEVVLIDRSSKAKEKLVIDYDRPAYVLFAGQNRVYMKVSSTSKSGAIIVHDLTTNKTDVVKKQRNDDISPEYISTPMLVEFKTTPDSYQSKAYGYFYPPKNPKYVGLKGTQPPLLVMAHGGPTGAASPAYSIQKQYYTTRGFAVFDVDYRGSTGYGRRFRELLKKQWGVYDIQDVVEGSKSLAARGLADSNKFCITGGSAGGYVVLAAVTFHKTFSAGASHYGISDVGLLARETHKFESRYVDSLIGKWPEDRAIYEARSPLFHTESLSAPVIFFHGTDDKVVPLNQAEKFFEVLKEKKIPTALVVFKGEGHGFRRAESIKTALDDEYYFFCSVLNIKPSVKPTTKLDIVNLEAKKAKFHAGRLG